MNLRPWHSFLLFLLTLLPGVIQTWRRQNPVPGRDFSGRFRDFYEFFAAAEVLHRGGSAQEFFTAGKLGYLYPPLLATLLSPFTPLGIFACARLWLLFSLACLVTSAYLICKDSLRLYFPQEQQRRSGLIWLLAAAVGLLLVDRISVELKMQQCNTLLLLCWCAAAVYAAKRPWLAGLALAVGFNLKFVTVMAVPYLLLRRRFKAGLFFLGFTLVLAVAPALPLGYPLAAQLWQGTLRGLETASASQSPDTNDSSINSPDPPPSATNTTASRVFSMSRFGTSVTTGLLRVTDNLELPQLGWPLVIAAALGYLTLLTWVYRRSGLNFLTGKSLSSAAPPPYLPALEWAAVILLMLAFSPQTNSRHFVQHVLTFAYLLPVVLILPSRGTRLTALACIVVMSVSLWFPPGGNRSSLTPFWSNISGSTLTPLLLYVPVLHLALWAHRNKTPDGAIQT